MKNKSSLLSNYYQLCYFEGATENKSPDTRINQTILNKKDKALEKGFTENYQYAAHF